MYEYKTVLLMGWLISVCLLIKLIYDSVADGNKYEIRNF